MKMLTNLLGAAMVWLWMSSGTAHAQEAIEKSFKGIEVLEMDIAGVDVVYTGVDGLAEVRLSAMFGKDEDVARNFYMVSLSNTLKLSYKRGSNSPNNDKRFIHLEGPKNIRIKAKNSSGLLAVKGVDATETTLTVGSGLIRAEEIGGNLILKASSGKIRARQIKGDLSGVISSGQIELESVSGNVALTASSGSAKAKGIGGKVDAKLSSGKLELDDIAELGHVMVSSGSVKVRRAALGSSTYLQGSSGSIDITTDSDLQRFNYALKAGSGSLKVGNISESRNLVIENGAPATVKGAVSSGSIHIKNL